MKLLKTLLLTLSLSFAIWAQLDTTAERFFMYVYFYNSQENAGARLAFSTDGERWLKYNDEKPLFKPLICDGDDPLMRDPNIYFDSKTGVFHMTWTTQWRQDNIGYSSSKNLKEWSEQVMLPLGESVPNCKVCWAPEFFYDDIKDSVMVFWSLERGTIGKEAFYSMTKDFKHYTEPKTYFRPKNKFGEVYNIIDETLIKVGPQKYYLFFKDERDPGQIGGPAKDIHFVFGPTPQGPWWQGPHDSVSYAITKMFYEGPTAYIYGDELRVVYDPFLTPSSTDRSRVIKLSLLQGPDAPDSSAWTTGPVMKDMDGGNFLPSHGSISEVPKAKVLQLLYNIPDNTPYQSWTPVTQDDIVVDKPAAPIREYRLGKRNVGCGTGVGLAFLPPIAFKAFRKRKKKN